MESKTWGKDSQLINELKDKPSSFSFIQAVRILKLLKKIDFSGLMDRDIKIKPLLSLGFPGSDISNIKFHSEELIEITSTFLGLYGPSSPMPVFYTEELIDDRNQGETLKKDFLDIFNSLFFDLFYQTITKYRLVHKLGDENNRDYKNRLYALMGLGSHEIRQSFDKKDDLLKYLGILAKYPRSASELKTMVKDYFKLDHIIIDQCVRAKVSIEDDQRAKLGIENTSLGKDCHLGMEIEDYSGKFSIIMDNLDENSFHDFIPSGKSFTDLMEIVNFYLDQPLDAEIRLKPKKEELKPATLGQGKWGELGFNTWIFSKEYEPDQSEVKFDLN